MASPQRPPLPPGPALPPAGGPWVTVATIVGVTGLQGWVRALSATANPGRLLPGASVFLAGQQRRIQGARPRGAGLLLLLEGVVTRQQAEALRGQELQVPAAWLEPLPANTYYHYQIIGLQAVTTGGEPLGTVQEVLPTGSNDVYVVRGLGREILIPALSEAIRAVDIPGGRLVVEPIPGLVD